MLRVEQPQLRIPVVAFACVILLGTIALTQNRSSLQDRYGGPVGEVYRTPSSLLITPTFAPNGTLCTAHIQADRRRMKDAELNPVLEELAPKDARGKFVMGNFLEYTCIEINEVREITGATNCGGVRDDYERVTITKWGNTNDYNSADITYYRRGCKTKRAHHRR